MKQITQNIYAVEVPLDAKDFKKSTSLRYGIEVIDMFNSTLLYTFAKDHQGFEHLDGIGFQDFEILGTVTADKIDFDVSGLVEKMNWTNSTIWYMDYTHKGADKFITQNPFKSFRSLLTSKSIEITQKLLIIKKVK